jgi:hypothetical protein
MPIHVRRLFLVAGNQTEATPMSIVTLIGTLLGIFLIEKVGRRPAIVGGCLYPFWAALTLEAAVGMVVMTALYSC